MLGLFGGPLTNSILANAQINKEFLDDAIWELETLKKKAPEPKREDRYNAKLQELRTQVQFKAQEDAVKLFGEFETRKEIEKEFDRRRGEILKGRRLSQLSQEELDTLEDLEDAKQSAMDKL